MFFAIIFIAIGIAVLLNALGLFTGSFWGSFWGIVFLAIGVKMLTKDGCSICNWGSWKEKVHGKMQDVSHGSCCGHDHKTEKRNRE